MVKTIYFSASGQGVVGKNNEADLVLLLFQNSCVDQCTITCTHYRHKIQGFLVNVSSCITTTKFCFKTFPSLQNVFRPHLEVTPVSSSITSIHSCIHNTTFSICSFNVFYPFSSATHMPPLKQSCQS